MQIRKKLSFLKPIYTAQQTEEFDRFTTDDLKIPPQLLMENAGLAVAKRVIKSLKDLPDASIRILAGPGNNGADALVAARHLLSKGISCSIYLVDEARANSQVGEQLKILKSLTGYQLLSLEQFHQENCPTIAVDGIFGAGLNRKPEGSGLKAIELINQTTHVISIDIPSGLSLEAKTPFGAYVQAHHTITFGALKRAHISEPTKAICGAVEVADIGLFLNSRASGFYIDDQKTLTELFLPLPHPCHKGKFGHVLVFEGHPRFGAYKLSTYAALRVGAGLTTIGTFGVKTNQDPFEFMHIDLNNLKDHFLEGISSVVIGPGLSLEPSWQKLALSFLKRLQNYNPLIVIDADALGLIKHPELLLKEKQMVCTPHPKEAASLLGSSTEEVESDRFLALKRLSEIGSQNHIIWLLKGETPLVRALDGTIFAFRGNIPGLSCGGMGDVLSGAIAGLYKQVPSAIDSVLLAVSMQLESAKILSKKGIKGFLASELADQFPKLRRKL